MKLLIFVDIHGSLKALDEINKTVKRENPDLLICSGDISIFENNLYFLLKRLNSLNKPLLIVHGNHESEDTLEKVLKNFKNFFFIHKRFYIKDNYLFIGFGGGGFSFTHPNIKTIEKRFKNKIKNRDYKKIILITHAPPYGTKLDSINNEHCGNKTITDFIKKYNIELVICGHLHENARVTDKIRNTLIINPGAFGRIINI
jgi:hypothetical protein